MRLSVRRFLCSGAWVPEAQTCLPPAGAMSQTHVGLLQKQPGGAVI